MTCCECGLVRNHLLMSFTQSTWYQMRIVWHRMRIVWHRMHIVWHRMRIHYHLAGTQAPNRLLRSFLMTYVHFANMLDANILIYNMSLPITQHFSLFLKSNRQHIPPGTLQSLAHIYFAAQQLWLHEPDHEYDFADSMIWVKSVIDHWVCDPINQMYSSH